MTGWFDRSLGGPLDPVLSITRYRSPSLQLYLCGFTAYVFRLLTPSTFVRGRGFEEFACLYTSQPWKEVGR